MPSAWTEVTAVDGGSNFDWVNPRVGFEFESAIILMTDIVKERAKLVDVSVNNIIKSNPNFMQWSGLTQSVYSTVKSYVDKTTLPSDPDTIAVATELRQYNNVYPLDLSIGATFTQTQFWDAMEILTSEDLTRWRVPVDFDDTTGFIIDKDLMRQFYVLMGMCVYIASRASNGVIGGGNPDTTAGYSKDGSDSNDPNDTAFSDALAQHDADISGSIILEGKIFRRVYWNSSEQGQYTIHSAFASYEWVNRFEYSGSEFHFMARLIPLTTGTFDDFGLGYIEDEIYHDTISEAGGTISWDVNILKDIDFSGNELKPNSSGVGDERSDTIGFRVFDQIILMKIDLPAVIDYYTP